MNISKTLALATLCLAACSSSAQNLRADDAPRPDIIIADFEGMDYGDWKVEGDAFGERPVSATFNGGMGPIYNFTGERLVCTYAAPNFDAGIGTLTSPEFKIERNYILFSIGGGNFPDETGIELLIDGKRVAVSSGLFAESHKGDERLERRAWDVSKYVGQTAKIVIFDRKTGDWGHIKVDHIVQSDDASSAAYNTVAPAVGTKPVEYDRMILGQFIEHFHRQVYGGIFEPGSKLSDEIGLRKDVVEALRELKVPIVRWPGGCFVSAYHWLGGVGPDREPYYDKAWHVEDPNTFGTAEFVQWCRAIGAEPFICTNAGTGTQEEMSDWVEYCNLNVGKFGRLRKKHGYEEPFKVKYWSVGNENWGGHEMGAKTVDEWGPLVREAAKLMVNTDPEIKIFAAALPNEGWTLPLLQTAGRWLDYVSVHGYWIWGKDAASMPYEACMTKTTSPEQDIIRTIDILERTGMRDRVKIAFDEWNLRGWYHPGMGNPKHVDFAARDRNDENNIYTMADAVFASCFLNTCLRHSKDVKIACFSPVVNVRGALYVYPEGIVKRPTFHVFKMYADLLEKYYVPFSWTAEPLSCNKTTTPKADVALTCNEDQTRYVLVAANKDPKDGCEITVNLGGKFAAEELIVRAVVLQGHSPDDYNDVGRENSVVPEETTITVKNGKAVIPAHSVAFLIFE